MQKSKPSSPWPVLILMMYSSILLFSLFTKPTSAARMGVNSISKMVDAPAPAPMDEEGSDGNADDQWPSYTMPKDGQTPAPSPMDEGDDGASSPSYSEGPATAPSPTDPDLVTVYIVYTKPPPDEGADPRPYYIKTLATIFGGDEGKAKAAITYPFTTTSGFVANISPNQADQVLNNPDVLQVEDVQGVKMHSGN